MDALGGHRNFLSGAGPDKADGRVAEQVREIDGIPRVVKPGLRVEVKERSAARYTLTATDWGKLQTIASRGGEYPIFTIRMGSWKFVVITTDFAKELFPDRITNDLSSAGKKSFSLNGLDWVKEFQDYQKFSHKRFILNGFTRVYDLVVMEESFFAIALEKWRSSEDS